MWKRSYVNDFSNFDTCTVDSSNSRLTSVTWTLHICFYLSQAKIVCYLSTVLSSHLCCIRSVLLRTSKSHLSGRRPRNNLTFTISQRNNNVVER